MDVKLIKRMCWSDDPDDVTTIWRGYSDYMFYISDDSRQHFSGGMCIDSVMDKLWTNHCDSNDPDLINKMDEIHQAMINFKKTIGNRNELI